MAFILHKNKHLMNEPKWPWQTSDTALPASHLLPSLLFSSATITPLFQMGPAICPRLHAAAEVDLWVTLSRHLPSVAASSLAAEEVACFYKLLKREIIIPISLGGPRTQRGAQPNHSGCGSDRPLITAAKAVSGQGDCASVPSPVRCVERLF